MLLKPLFIHGWAFSSKVFSSLPGIKVNLPSHGDNREPYRDLDSLVKEIALSLSSYHDVVGWSLGGSVALLLALRFPSKVRRVFLVGTSPYFKGAWSEKNIRAFRMMIRRRGIEAFRKIAYPKEFSDHVEGEGAMRMLEDYIELDLRSKLPYLKKEAFILQGIEDNVVPVGEAFKLHNLIKGSKLILLPGGHFPAENERSLLTKILKVG